MAKARRGSILTPVLSTFLLIAAATALAASLFALLAGRLKATARGRPVPSPPVQTPAGPRPGSCPLCGSLLGQGERVKSDIFPGQGDRLMRIFGCPHCLPAGSGKAERRCPVCGSGLPAEGFAYARYFERPGRRHVHILGCESCRKQGKGNR